MITTREFFEHDAEDIINNIDIAPQITFEDIPEHWVCPIYGFGKDVFVLLEG